MHPRILLLVAAALLSLPTAALAEPVRSDSDSGRVVLVPLNLAVRAAPEVEPGIDPVWEELVRYFEAREPRVASLARDSATDLWKAAASEPEARDGAGKRNVYAAYAHFARRVAQQVEYDSIVIPSLVMRAAKARGQRATWDGVHRIVDTPRAAIAGFETQGNVNLAVNGIRGNIGAVSLHVAVLTPEGELRFEGTGGLALLQRPALTPEEGGNGVRLTPKSEPFDDRNALREGIESAFVRPLPGSRAP